MPITYTCSCGKTLRVADVHAGKRVKCPACDAIGNAPAPAPEPEPEPVFEVVEVAPKPLPRPAVPPKPKPVDDDDEDDAGADAGVYGLDKRDKSSLDGSDADDEPRDKPLPDFRQGPGQYGKKRRRKK